MGNNGKFHFRALPLPAQASPVFAITVLDYDKDGKQDLLLCGNINQARLRFGKYDAGYGVLLKGDGGGNFEYVPQWKSGFRLWGDVRSVLQVNDTWLFGINQNTIRAYKGQQTHRRWHQKKLHLHPHLFYLLQKQVGAKL